MKKRSGCLIIVVVKDSQANTILAKVAPSKGVEHYAVEVAKRAVELLGHRRIIMRKDRAPAI